ncbi:hypothetical protein PPYR_11722 [Photinus pyralis]|uniref:Uncharacterized protein n=1 Tax=Photinus pyralis TaxID=7054 RepID=A0A5N4AC23_PHOPY|nr:uncharacterized protein LOC116176365 [Photinus pyralis]KAB0794883.1 hypothetical protein PPYR_11722 [Photinus pyralis]
MDRFCSVCGARKRLNFDFSIEKCEKCNQMPYILSFELKSSNVLRCSVCVSYICESNRYCEICGHTVERSKIIRSKRAIENRDMIRAKKNQALERRRETHNMVKAETISSLSTSLRLCNGLKPDCVEDIAGNTLIGRR